ncbi:MAG: S8 family serine peptidase [Bacillota bacterium]
MKKLLVSSLLIVCVLLLGVAAPLPSYSLKANPVPPEPFAGNSVLDHFHGAEIISQETKVNLAFGSSYKKITLLRSDNKYPFIRVEDTFIRTTGVNSAASERILDSKAMVADHIIVKLKPGIQSEHLDSLAGELGGSIRRKLSLSERSYLMSFNNYNDSNEIYKIIDMLSKDDMVEYAEPDYIAFVSEIPDDPDFPYLWGFNNLGQTEGTPDADIDAPEAWDIAKGSRNVVVAVLDSGIDYNHPDLIENMWRNPGETPDNGIDDDQNGYIDDVYGWDFVNDDNDPQDDNEYGHGTHVAGTIGAVGNNGQGIAGVSWNVSLAALKCFDKYGGAQKSDIIEALNYAVRMRMPITSNSWSAAFYSLALEEAFKKADENGILSIVAAGNFASDIELYPKYPASFTFPSIISVASTGHTDNLSWFSDYGKNSVDLGAPGENIYSTNPDNQYRFLDGTSMATPHVTGAAALIKSMNFDLSNLEIKKLILDNVDPVESLNGITVTGGRLNVYNIVKNVPMPAATPAPGSITVKMYNLSSQSLTNSIHPYFMLTNTSSEGIKLSDAKLRYYYTIDGDKTQKFWSDWSSIGSQNVTGSFIRMPYLSSKADYYLELGFTDSAGFLSPGESVSLQVRFSKEDWSNYDQSNDFSFSPAASYFEKWDKVTLYIGDSIVWGSEPYKQEPTLSPTPTPTFIPTPSSTPTPSTPPAYHNITVSMYNSNKQGTTSGISPYFLLTNTGSSSIRLSDIKLRYYYTVDGEKMQNYWCDWSSIGSQNITGSFVKIPSHSKGADYYLEVGFTDASGYLNSGESATIQMRFSKADWSDYNQTNDFSFNSSAAGYELWNKVTVYVSGSLVWGSEP